MEILITIVFWVSLIRRWIFDRFTSCNLKFSEDIGASTAFVREGVHRDRGAPRIARGTRPYIPHHNYEYNQTSRRTYLGALCLIMYEFVYFQDILPLDRYTSDQQQINIKRNALKVRRLNFVFWINYFKGICIFHLANERTNGAFDTSNGRIYRQFGIRRRARLSDDSLNARWSSFRSAILRSTWK